MEPHVVYYSRTKRFLKIQNTGVMNMELSLGKKIRELRKARGVTQEELAGALGISFQAVSKWETEYSLSKSNTIVTL